MVRVEKPPPDPSRPYISFHATVISILSATHATSGFGLMVIHKYKPAIQTIKQINESSNHIQDVSRPPPSTVSTTPLPIATIISQRQSDAESLFSESPNTKVTRTGLPK